MRVPLFFYTAGIFAIFWFISMPFILTNNNAFWSTLALIQFFLFIGSVYMAIWHKVKEKTVLNAALLLIGSGIPKNENGKRLLNIDIIGKQIEVKRFNVGDKLREHQNTV